MVYYGFSMVFYGFSMVFLFLNKTFWKVMEFLWRHGEICPEIYLWDTCENSGERTVDSLTAIAIRL